MRVSPLPITVDTDSQAKPGQAASNTDFPRSAGTAGHSTTNTSSSLQGAGGLGTGSAQPVDVSDAALKNPRKTDGPAHSAPGGTLHGGT